MNSILQGLLREYKMRFYENFPLLYFKDSTEAETIKVISECLDANKPLEIDSDIII